MDREEIKQAMKEVFDDSLKPFFVDREQHYQDHQFIKDLREFCGSIKNTVLKTIVRVAVMAVLGLMIAGFIVWMNYKG